LPKVQVNLLLFLLFGSFAPCQTPTQPLVDQESQHSPLRVPDGTMVVLRFAEPLVGVPQYQVPASLNHAKKGDLVRLVVATDLRFEDVLVIRKGSLAQATVMKASVPSQKYSDSGLLLRFDWIKSVNGVQIPIRQKHNSKSNKTNNFGVFLFTTRTGTHLGFGLERRNWGDALSEGLKVETRKQWTVVPTGTRVKAYINGDFALDFVDVKKAQTEFPSRNPTAIVTIYREKGPRDQQPSVVCDGKQMGKLSDWQYALLEMNPGKHACQVKDGENLEFSVAAGDELYLTLHHAKLSGKWKLTQVDPATGEDATAFSEPLEEKQVLSPPANQP